MDFNQSHAALTLSGVMDEHQPMILNSDVNSLDRKHPYLQPRKEINNHRLEEYLRSEFIKTRD